MDFNSTIKNFTTELDAKREQKTGPFGVPSGLTDLDKLTSGFQKGNLCILAGRPSMGKSALAINIMRNAAVDYKKGVAYFSLQLTEIEIANRIMSAETEIEINNIISGNLAEHQWDQLAYKAEGIKEAPIFIKSYHKVTTDVLAAEAHVLVKRGIQLIIVDDIQSVVLTYEQKKLASSREQEVSIIVRELKALAKELDVPVLGISQLNRAVETRGGERIPQLIDLRDSGALENDSDLVMFLYRPEYYGIMENENGMPLAGVAEIFVAKHRNGPLESAELKFRGKYSKFYDMDHSSDWGYNSYGNTEHNPISSLAKMGGIQTFGSMKKKSKGKKGKDTSNVETFGSKINEDSNGKKDSGFGYTSFPEEDAPF